MAPWPLESSESMSCLPLQFVILRGVYVAAQHLSFILLSIDIKLPRKELSLSLRSCSNGSFFIALGSPFISLQFVSGMVLRWGHLHLWPLSLSLIFPLDFLRRYEIAVLLFITVFFRSFWLTWLFQYLSHLVNFNIYPCWSLIYYQASSSTFLPCSPSQEMSPNPSTEPVLRRPNRS